MKTEYRLFHMAMGYWWECIMTGGKEDRLINDLLENFIKAEDGTIYLIDWEYSGMNDPMADFAALFIESEFSEDSQDYFLRKYYQDAIPPQVKERILCYEILWDTLWAQWTVIKEACGDDFGSYGLDRYTRAKENYKQLTSKH